MTENRDSDSKSLFVGRKEQILEFGQTLPLRVVSVRLNEYEDLVQKLNAQIKKLEQELEQSKDYNGILYANQNREMRELMKENEQLKKQLQEIQDYIENTIKRNEEAIEWGKSKRADVGTITFYNEMLKKMKGDLND